VDLVSIPKLHARDLQSSIDLKGAAVRYALKVRWRSSFADASSLMQWCQGKATMALLIVWGSLQHIFTGA